MAKARSKTPPRELASVLDFIRYAVTRFAEGKVTFGQGTEDPVEEAIFLVAEALGLPITRTDPFLAARLTAAERQRVFALIEQRVTRRVPAAYLLKRAYLQGVPFYVDERVIIPRSYIAELLNGGLFAGDSPLIEPTEVTRALDLCTGSGCLAVLASHTFPHAQVDAVEISKDALAVAKINVAEHGLEDRIKLHKGDLFGPVGDAVYDVIISNPPYVDAKAVASLPAEFAKEPELAHAGGRDGLDIVRRIIAEAPAHLSPQGGLLCEIGRGRAILERDFPQLDFLWVDTEESSGEVFWITAEGLRG
ncbi:MAG TPA: 50S ribosomal protein L3 N(5)-glutamine methyltransferase [Pseudolabrys sp.]|nr:50S ribosomal protein L3 N(5)-glutamine methyltransferase [Pseudolabrys sp.]